MTNLLLSSRKGFSILIALGSTGVLMIIVIGMIQVFLTEMKLSRYQYDYIVASEQVEGAFEYAMLKVANHRDGFEDTMTQVDLDQILFSGSTSRSQNNTVTYTILAQTGSFTRTVNQDDYLIFSLFTGNGEKIVSRSASNNPSKNTGSTVTQNLRMTISGNPEDISWNIIAMSGTTNISLSGTGEINGIEIGTSRMRGIECFDNLGQSVPPQNGECPDFIVRNGGEALQYFYDTTSSVDAFLEQRNVAGVITQVTDPFLLIYHKGVSPMEVTLTSSPFKKFSLPVLSITVEARKGNAVQTIRFRSDKSKYYDGLKYAIYNKEPSE